MFGDFPQIYFWLHKPTTLFTNLEQNFVYRGFLSQKKISCSLDSKLGNSPKVQCVDYLFTYV